MLNDLEAEIVLGYIGEAISDPDLTEDYIVLLQNIYDKLTAQLELN